MRCTALRLLRKLTKSSDAITVAVTTTLQRGPMRHYSTLDRIRAQKLLAVVWHWRHTGTASLLDEHPAGCPVRVRSTNVYVGHRRTHARR